MAVKCFYHKRRDAVGACVNCGRLICADCEVTLKKKIYCNPCVEELFGEKETAAASAPPAPPAPAAVEVAPAEEVAQPSPRAPKKAVAAAKAEVAAATTADNTSGQGKGAVIPPEVRGWNWGAFLLNWMWGIGNKVGIALLTFILGPIMAIILGVKGNEWAWRNKKWKSVEKFKKTQRAWTWAGVALFCVPIVLAVLVMALSGQSEPTTLKWKEQQTIKQPLTVNMAGQDVMLGSLETQQVEVKLPGTAFQQPAQVTVKNAKKAPAVPSAEFTPLGALIEIDTGELPARLYELATITFKIDKASMESHPDSGSYWVAYYTGSEWEYIKPDEVNLAEGTISIQTDHFSLWGWGEISVDKYLEEYTKNKAVAEYAQEQVDEKVQEALGSYLQDMCGKLGVKDELKSELLAGVFTDKEYDNLIKSVKDEDTGAFTENLAKLLGNNMQKILDKKELDKIGKIKNPLGTTLEKADDVATFAAALGYAYEENYTEAAKILGEYALKKSIYGQAFLALKEGGEYIAEDLTNRLFEQSYQVYSKGASEPIWGFIPSFGMNNIPAHAFDLVWLQSNKVRQVLIERYKLKGFGEQAETKAQEYLQNLFDEREKREAEIVQKQNEINELLDIFREGAEEDPTADGVLENFLFPLQKSWGITTRLKCPPEGKLDELLKIVETIKKDTGTTTVGGELVPGVLQKQDLVLLASALIKSRPDLYDPDYRSPEYLEVLKRYTFSITAPSDILEGKGITGTHQYSFTAKGKNVGDWPHYTWSVNGKEVPNSDRESFLRAFTSPGDYTLKCKASWTSGMSGHFTIPTEAVATLTFHILEPSELKISAPEAILAGKGVVGTQYAFTATGKGIPGQGVIYTWSSSKEGKESILSASTATIRGPYTSPGKYTLKCLAKWTEKASGGQTVDREAAGTLTFDILVNLTISPSVLSGEPGKSYPFTVTAAGAPAGASYQWYVDGKLMTGNTDKNTITFRDEGTYDIDVKLVQEGQVLAQGFAKANIKAATPIPPPTQQVPLEAKGSLNIGSVPAGADIYINGQKQGYQTNVNFTNVEAGNYTVVLKKAGYKDFSATATVAEGRITEMLAKLEAVESEPATSSQPTPTQPTQPTPVPATGATRQRVDYCLGTTHLELANGDLYRGDSSSPIHYKCTEIRTADGYWMLHGTHTTYYCPPYGNGICSTTTYVDGRETGPREDYNTDGKHTGTTEFVNGDKVKITTYDSKGRPYEICTKTGVTWPCVYPKYE